MSFYAQLDGLPTVTEFEMADAGLIYVFVCFDCFEVTALLHRAVVEVFAVARERSRWRGIGTSGLQPGAGGATAAARVIPAWRRRQVRPGSRLSTVRQLARDLDVSPTTVAHAYRELERDDLAYGAGRKGTIVADHPVAPHEPVEVLAQDFVTRARRGGLTAAPSSTR